MISAFASALLAGLATYGAFGAYPHWLVGLDSGLAILNALIFVRYAN